MIYRADIDGIRALAIIPVVIYHFFPTYLTGGFSGVDIFFVISGYLITFIILDEMNNDKFSFLEFYKRRIKRLFPALIITFGIVIIFGYFVLSSDEYKQLSKHLLAGTFFIPNFIYWDESGYFDTISEAKPLLHLWSLGVEEQFYMLWPIVLFILWKYKLKLPIYLGAFMVISLIANIATMNSDSQKIFYLPWYRAWELLAGGFLALVHLKKGYLRSYYWNTILSLMGLVLVCVGFIEFHKGLACIRNRFLAGYGQAYGSPSVTLQLEEIHVQ
jgi:peptidoglycan/LPS O-acetylase OafA/YrhL